MTNPPSCPVSLAQYDKIIEMDASFRRGFEGRGMIFLAKGENEKAVNDFEKYHKLIGNPLKGFSALGHAYAAAGYTDKAFECLEIIQQRKKTNPVFFSIWIMHLFIQD